MFPGNWHSKIVDLGNIAQGNDVVDTYFVTKELISTLIKQNIVPIVIGGSQDLTLANYRAYDSLEQTVNLAVVDNKFDIGEFEDNITSQNYLYK